jgi:hypothetical protein
MHFHLPKPLNGWREFAGEVGIIVIGVLIALAAEQVAEAIQWRHKVGVVRSSLMGELGNDRARWEINMADTPCYGRDVAWFDDWAKAGATGDAAKTLAEFDSLHLFWMHSANWSLATGSETLDHFPIDQQLAFASLYDGLAHRQTDIEKASSLFERIETLVPLAADPEARRDLRVALGTFRQEVTSLASNSAYMKRHFDALGVKPDRSDFAAEATPTACQR